jgi:phospho-N-acetylmuramoyl-pentapeptide-transferase
MKLIMALAIGFMVSSGVGAFLVPFLRKIKVQQHIKEIGPNWHMSKSGTPSMGGFMFMVAIAVVCLTVGFEFTLRGSWGHIFVLVFGMVFGAIGFLDDYEKLRHKQNTGLSAKAKFLLQLAAAICFLFLLRRFGYLQPHLYIPFWNVTFSVNWIVYMAFAMFVIVGGVNAVNLTDGVDGLASGVTVPVMVFFTVAAMGQTNGLALVPAAMIGALLGFLCYNFHPAKVFMGDTGSLFLGGLVCGLAFALDMPLILIPVGIVYIAETLSVILQVGYFKLTHGKRLFRMSPLHHHFELCGWSEVKIFVVFTGITAVMCILAWLGVCGRA